MGIRTDIYEVPDPNQWVAFCEWCHKEFMYRDAEQNEYNDTICPLCNRMALQQPNRLKKDLECPHCFSYFKMAELDFPENSGKAPLQRNCPHCNKQIWFKTDSLFAYKSKEAYEISNPTLGSYLNSKRNSENAKVPFFSKKAKVAFVLLVIYIFNVYGAFERPLNYSEALKQYPRLIEEESTTWTDYYQEPTIYGSNGWEKPGAVRIISGTSTVKRNGKVGWTNFQESWCFSYLVNGSRNSADGEYVTCYPLRINIFTGTISGDGILDSFRNSSNRHFSIDWK